ncbi:DUF2073 domain-containing protein [Candidatus Babeliales bacterium]|nr:DUF2073 domain-containing protein [Candidatus Babeliales bacterium]MCF7910748.1 DUF2073 domain-containing protein [Candidatus Pacearchaeota archaeon]
MVTKKKTKKKNLGKIRGFSIQFIPFSEIRNLNSDERIRKILDIVLGNNIIILQGRLKTDEESRLIGDTMAMIGHVKHFKGIELAVISENNDQNLFSKFKSGIVNVISRGEIGAITIIGPATIVKEIKRNPKKIELLLNK